MPLPVFRTWRRIASHQKEKIRNLLKRTPHPVRFAEMDCARKYDVSHRARALQKLQTFFKEENEAKRFAEERDVLEDMCIWKLFSDMDIHG